MALQPQPRAEEPTSQGAVTRQKTRSSCAIAILDHDDGRVGLHLPILWTQNAIFDRERCPGSNETAAPFRFIMIYSLITKTPVRLPTHRRTVVRFGEAPSPCPNWRKTRSGRCSPLPLTIDPEFREPAATPIIEQQLLISTAAKQFKTTQTDTFPRERPDSSNH